MKVTIIVPVYKVESYLKDCLDSILAQSYKDLEIILIDDGSPDACPQICDEYAKQDIRIKVIHRNNAGVSVARNNALDIATGEYICFVDSDDTIHPDMIKNMVNLAIRYPNVDLIQGNIITFDSKREMHSCFDNFSRIEFSVDIAWIRKQILSYQIPVHPTSKLFRRSYIEENRIRFPKDVIHEDRFWTFYLQKKIHSIAFCYEPCYYYRITNNSLSRAEDCTRRVCSYMELFRLMLFDTKNIDEYKFVCDPLEQECRFEYWPYIKNKQFVNKVLVDTISELKKEGATLLQLFPLYSWKFPIWFVKTPIYGKLYSFWWKRMFH